MKSIVIFMSSAHELIKNYIGSPYEWREQAAQALMWGDVKELKV